MSMHATHRVPPLILILVILGTMVSFPGPAGAEENRDFEYAAGLHADGGFDMAIREFERFIDAYPSSDRRAEAYYCLADSWHHLRRFDFAAEITARIRTEYPSTPIMDRVLILEGKALFNLQRYREAIFTLNQFLSGYSGSELAPEALYTIAECRLALKDTRQATEIFRKIADAHPGSASAEWAWYNLGVIAEEQGDFRGAIESFGQMFRKYPRSSLRSDCRFRMGECYFRLSDYKNAVSMMNDVVSAAGDREMKARAWYILGEANFHLGDYSAARKSYQTVCDEYPNDPLAADAREAVGWTYYQEKRFDRAAEIFALAERKTPEKDGRDAEQFRQALTRKLAGDISGATGLFTSIPDRFPESRYAEQSVYELGMISWDAGRFPEAADLFQRMASRYPKSELKPEALIMYGQCLVQGKDYGSALTAFTEVTDSYRNAPSYPVALYGRSFCEFKLQQFDAACLTADRFIRMLPDHALAPDASLVLSESRYRLGDYTGSREACLAALEKYPRSPRLEEILYGCGWASFRIGDYGKAAETFSRFLERYPRSPYAVDAAFRVGDCRYARGEFSGAAEAYQTALDRYPEASFAGKAAFQCGQAAFRSGDFKRALSAADLVLSRYPKAGNPDEIRNLKGMSLLNLQRYPEAVEEFKTIVKPSPLADEALFQTGICYQRLETPDKAVESWERLLKEFARSPRVSEAVCAMADIHRSKGEGDRALQRVDDFLKRYPKEKVTDAILIRKGELSSDRKKYDDAITAFRRVIEEFPSSGSIPRAWYGLGLASRAKGDLEGARTAFGNLSGKYPASEYTPLAAKQMETIGRNPETESEPADSEIPEERETAPDSVDAGADSAAVDTGAALLRAGKTAEGEEILQTIISRHSTDVLADRARLELAENALNREDWDTAAELAGEVTEHRMDENAAHAKYLLGKRWYLAEDYTAAERELLKAASLYRTFGEWVSKARLLAARSQVKLGKRDAARSTLKELLAADPGEDVKKEAQELMNGLQVKKK